MRIYIRVPGPMRAKKYYNRKRDVTVGHRRLLTCSSPLATGSDRASSARQDRDDDPSSITRPAAAADRSTRYRPNYHVIFFTNGILMSYPRHDIRAFEARWYTCVRLWGRLPFFDKYFEFSRTTKKKNRSFFKIAIVNIDCTKRRNICLDRDKTC